MVVVIQLKNRYEGAITISELNKEYTVVDLGPNIDDYIVEGYLDLSELKEGDVVRVCEYIGLGAITYVSPYYGYGYGGEETTWVGEPKPLACVDYRGPLKDPIIRFHAKTLLRDMKYRITGMQIAGTPKTIFYGFIEEIMGEA